MDMADFLFSDTAKTALTAALSIAALAALWYLGLSLNSYIFRGHRRHGGSLWKQGERARKQERARREKERAALRKKYAYLNKKPESNKNT